MPVKNICQCVYPPGGQGQCEPDQLAICRARGGQCVSKCSNPPLDAVTTQSRYAWALEEITGQRHVAPLSTNQMDVLKKGMYVDPKTQEVVTFVLPRTWLRNVSNAGSASA
jgi:hypothetical protein